MMNILEKSIASLMSEVPQTAVFFNDYGLWPDDGTVTVGEYLKGIGDDHYEDIGIDCHVLIENLEGFLQQFDLAGRSEPPKVSEITIIGGHDKDGRPEEVLLTLVRGSISSIVGPTGSGKSRLLADIEWMAQNDTPTGRSILVNGHKPDPELRFSLEYKLVAQLSQNMNFVMDTTVAEFIAMHAESRMVSNSSGIVEEIIRQANQLAGEPFLGSTPVTSLSGGQSRALMIADTAFLSTSPVVLIDEIENAGIDRKKALSLLVRREKIVLMATHDPILALMAERRLVIKNGGIERVITTTPKEKENLAVLEALDNNLMRLRSRLRGGELIEEV